MLQNAGRPSRAQHVESEEALVKLLQEQVWDLLIAHDQTENVSPLAAIKQIRRLNKDVPVILQTDEESTQPIVEGIKHGAANVVRLDEDQHLLLIIQRELENREQRQLRRIADRRFHEAERRSQQLLDSSRDAIAYVQDGMYLYANESFAERFGYEDRDDIEIVPVVDMVADQDLDHVKKFLKEFTLKGDDVKSSVLEFTGVLQNGKQARQQVQVAHAIYDEEPCIQFMMRGKRASTAVAPATETSTNNEQLEAQITQIKQEDPATGLFNRQYLMESLEQAVDKAARNEANSVLLYIDIDNFQENVPGKFGLTGSDTALKNVAGLIKEHCQKEETLARFSDGSFILLANSLNADKAVERANDICKRLEDHIIDIDSKTLQLTLSIGVALINETASNAETVIDEAVKAIASVRSNGTDGVGNGAKLFEPEQAAKEMSPGDIAGAVQKALDNNRFKLLFQPIISLRGSEEEHYEVLLRMLNDEDVEIAPNDFLSVAEKTNSVQKVDRWVILEAIKLLSAHREKGNKTRLILNLNHQSITDESLIPWLNVAFKAAKLPTDALIFQMNEVDVTNHLNSAKAFVKGLKEINCRSAISSFGCSLNPFNTLKHVSTDYVKVDGSFTLDIQNNNESPDALINLIKKLLEEEKTTIVPFVENASVLSTLWQAGVHYIQGHYLQAPTSTMDYDFNMEN